MQEERTKFCPHCGTMIPYIETYCPSCGEPQPDLEFVYRKPEKKVWVAVLLSFLITGLGHVYLGRWRRGITIFGATLAVGGVASFYFTYEQVMALGVLIALVSAYDAYLLARHSRQA